MGAPGATNGCIPEASTGEGDAEEEVADDPEVLDGPKAATPEVVLEAEEARLPRAPLLLLVLALLRLLEDELPPEELLLDEEDDDADTAGGSPC